MKEQIREIAKKYAANGFIIVGIFGSQAEGSGDEFSDVDIAYIIDHDRFYPNDAFKKLLALEEIKKELQYILKRRVDLVPYNSKFEVVSL